MRDARYNPTFGREFGVALLKMLGYDTEQHRVKSLIVILRADGPPLVRITEFVTVEQEQKLVEYAKTVSAGDNVVQVVASQ